MSTKRNIVAALAVATASMATGATTAQAISCKPRPPMPDQPPTCVENIMRSAQDSAREAATRAELRVRRIVRRCTHYSEYRPNPCTAKARSAVRVVQRTAARAVADSRAAADRVMRDCARLDTDERPCSEQIRRARAEVRRVEAWARAVVRRSVRIAAHGVRRTCTADECG